MEEWEKEKEHIYKILKGGRTLIGCVDYIVALDCPERQKVKLAFLTGATIGSLRPFIEIKEEEEEEETLITILHRVSMDKCIAEEVEELNNVHNILTLFSCCGHGDIGYIVVHEHYEKAMEKLGYKKSGRFSTSTSAGEDDHMNKYPAYEPKSECHCS
jgi:hypothetical protein